VDPRVPVRQSRPHPSSLAFGSLRASLADCGWGRIRPFVAAFEASCDGSRTVEFNGTERYELIRRLGAGGMGVVYEARDRDRGDHVALKTLRRAQPATIA